MVLLFFEWPPWYVNSRHQGLHKIKLINLEKAPAVEKKTALKINFVTKNKQKPAKNGQILTTAREKVLTTQNKTTIAIRPTSDLQIASG